MVLLRQNLSLGISIGLLSVSLQECQEYFLGQSGDALCAPDDTTPRQTMYELFDSLPIHGEFSYYARSRHAINVLNTQIVQSDHVCGGSTPKYDFRTSAAE